MGLVGPIRKKPKATCFFCMPFIKLIWATEKVYSHTSMKSALRKHIPVSHLYYFLIWFMHLNTCVRGYLVSSIQNELVREDMLLSPIIESACCVESETGTSLCISLLTWWTTGRERDEHWPESHRDMAVPLLEQYANPLLNFIFSNPFNQKQGNKASW